MPPKEKAALAGRPDHNRIVEDSGENIEQQEETAFAVAFRAALVKKATQTMQRAAALDVVAP